MKTVKSLRSPLNSLPTALNRVNQLAVRTTNQAGRQIKNAGNATDPQDLVTLSQLQQILADVAASQAFSTTSNSNVSTISGSFSVLPIISNAISIDLSTAVAFKVILNQSTQININAPTWSGVASIPAGTLFYLNILQDGTGGRPTPTFTTSAGGFAPDVVSLPYDGGTRFIDRTPNTNNPYVFMLHDDGYWHLISVQIGLPY